MANTAQVKNLYRLGLFREADAGGLKNYVGKDANYIVSEMLGSQERKNLEADINNLRTQFPKVQAKVATLNTQLQTLTKQMADNDAKARALVESAQVEVATLNTQLQTLTKQLADNDRTYSDALKELQTEIGDYKQSYDELTRTIEIKDKEIKRLEALAGEEVTVGRAISVLVEAIKNLVRR